MNKIVFLTLALIIQLQVAKSQNVAINNDGSPPDSNAILDVKSTSKGVLLPRMTTAQRMNIQNPPEGLLIFDTDANALFFTDTSGVGNNWNNVMNSILELPYSQGGSFQNSAFEVFNNIEDSTSFSGKFEGGYGTGIYGDGKIGGKFFGTKYGIYAEGSTAAKFYSGNIGVHIDVNGNAAKALIVEDGLTGLGTMNPQAQLHVFVPGASGQTPLFRVTRKEEGQPELGLTFQLEQQYADMPEVAYGNLGMMSNTRLNLMTNNDLLHPAISMLENKVGINKKDGTYPFSINGKTAFFENDVYVGEIFGDPSNGNLHLNAKNTPSGFENTPTHLILQTPIAGQKSGKVGINITNPTAFLEVGKGNFPNTAAAKFGSSKFDVDDDHTTYINGGESEEHGALYLNQDVSSGVYLVNGGGNVYMPHINSSLSIGTLDTTYKLNINGTIRSTELIVQTGWADYVFSEGYPIKPLREVEKYIIKNKHLPEIPTAEEIHTNGLRVSEMQTKMMAKIEELTLYLIEQNKKIEAMEKEIDNLKLNRK